VVHFLLLHVTVLLILAFFILFAAQKADGLVALFGYALGVWMLIVAVLHVAAFFMPGMMGMKGDMMHGRWMHHWAGEAQPQTAPAAPAQPAPTTPAPKKP